MKLILISSLLIFLCSFAFAKDHVLPDSVYSHIGEIASSNKSKEEQIHLIQEVFCNQNNPMYSVKYSFLYKQIDVSGMPLDEAANAKNDDLKAFRIYAKKKLLFESSGANYDGGFYGVGELEQAEEFKRLYVPLFHDMRLLINTFTFRLNKSELKGSTNTSVQYLGFDPFSQNFSASKAIEHRDMLWKWILNKDTRVLEAPKEDGTVAFTVEWAMDSFCKWSLPVTDLISR